MGLAVNVFCRNLNQDRVIPRFARYLGDYLGWTATAKPDYDADVIYLSGYFEAQLLKPWPDVPLAAYFTHIETQPPNGPKAKLFHNIAGRVQLRIATAAMYAAELIKYGETAQIYPPVERHRFTIPKRQPSKRLTAGFSGYSYSNGRKGESLARQLVKSKAGRMVDWQASGRGWPVPTKKYQWADMPAFYQSLDILVVSSLVEGIPMPPLEVMACGGSVVIPKGVGLLDELPDTPGIHRYKCGSYKSMEAAFEEAMKMRPTVERQGLRAVTEPYSIRAWCEQHRQAFEECFL